MKKRKKRLVIAKAATASQPKAQKQDILRRATSPQISPTWLQRIRSHPLIVAIGFVLASIVSFVSFLNNFAPTFGVLWPTTPVVSVDGLDAALPLRAPFIVTNKSAFFPLTITSLGCEIINLEPITKGDVDLLVGSDRKAYVISPNTSKPMDCKIRLGQRNDITRIKIRVILAYKHLWPLWGGQVNKTLTWTPNHWTVGEPMR